VPFWALPRTPVGLRTRARFGAPPQPYRGCARARLGASLPPRGGAPGVPFGVAPRTQRGCTPGARALPGFAPSHASPGVGPRPVPSRPVRRVVSPRPSPGAEMPHLSPSGV